MNYQSTNTTVTTCMLDYDLASASFQQRNADLCRPVNKAKLQKMLQDVANDNWDYDLPVKLIFDENGQLIDGQMVCLVVMETEVPMPAIRIDLASNPLTPKSLNTASYEKAETRLRNDIKYSNFAAPLARIIYGAEYKNPDWYLAIRSTNKIPTASIQDTCHFQTKEIETACAVACRMANNLTGSNRGFSYLALPVYIAMTHDDPVAFAQFEAELTNRHTKNKTIKALRKQIDKLLDEFNTYRRPSRSDRRAFMAGLILQGFQAFKNKKTVTSFTSAKKWLAALSSYDAAAKSRYSANVAAGRACKTI